MKLKELKPGDIYCDQMKLKGREAKLVVWQQDDKILIKSRLTNKVVLKKLDAHKNIHYLRRLEKHELSYEIASIVGDNTVSFNAKKVLM